MRCLKLQPFVFSVELVAITLESFKLGNTFRFGGGREAMLCRTALLSSTCGGTCELQKSPAVEPLTLPKFSSSVSTMPKTTIPWTTRFETGPPAGNTKTIEDGLFSRPRG